MKTRACSGTGQTLSSECRGYTSTTVSLHQPVYAHMKLCHLQCISALRHYVQIKLLLLYQMIFKVPPNPNCSVILCDHKLTLNSPDHKRKAAVNNGNEQYCRNITLVCAVGDISQQVTVFWDIISIFQKYDWKLKPEWQNCHQFPLCYPSKKSVLTQCGQ